MKRFAFAIFLSFLGLPCAATSQSGVAVSEMPYSGAPCTASGGIKPSASQVESFNRFDTELRSALKREDVAAVAFLIHFPLRVNTDKGTLLIPYASSLSGHFAEIFSPEVRDRILKTDSDDFICRYDEGLGYLNGVMWVSTEGHKFGIDAVNLPDTHAKFKKPVLAFTCETKIHRISIEESSDGKYRYRSWDKPKELSETPNVDLVNGELHFEGTGVCSYEVYSFTKRNVVYEVDSGMGCGDGTEPAKATGILTVTVAGKQVMQTYCF